MGLSKEQTAGKDTKQQTYLEIILENKDQVCACLSVTLGGFALGNVLAWTSPVEGRLPVSEEQFSWIGSLMALGAATVAFPIGFCMDRIGRKATMISLVIPFILGWVLIMWQKNFLVIAIGRFITGMSGGAFAVVAPVYIGEAAHKDIRGTLGNCFQLMIVNGILFVYLIGPFVSLAAISGMCSAIPVLFAGAICRVPETPMYYLTKGHVNEAKRSLLKLRKKDYDCEEELSEMKIAVEKADELKRNLKLRTIFMSSVSIRALIISLGLMFFQQLSGINAVIFYSQSIFKASGTGLEPHISTMIIGIVQVLVTFVSTLVVDRLGRRILLIISDSVMSFCTLILGVYMYLKYTKHDMGGLSWLPLISLCVFIIVFSLGYGPIPWLMVGELFPPEIKGIASPIACMSNWILAFLVTKFFGGVVIFWASHTAFWIFSVISATGTAFVFFHVIETKGKSLEDIQRKLGAKDEDNSYLPDAG